MLRPVCGQLYRSARTYLRINTERDDRRYAFKDACSRLVELKETMTVPAGYTMRSEAREQRKTSAVADFIGSLSQRNNKVNISHQLTLRKRVYDAADWNGFRTAVKAHKDFADEWLIFERK